MQGNVFLGAGVQNLAHQVGLVRTELAEGQLWFAMTISGADRARSPSAGIQCAARWLILVRPPLNDVETAPGIMRFSCDQSMGRGVGREIGSHSELQMQLVAERGEHDQNA